MRKAARFAFALPAMFLLVVSTPAVPAAPATSAPSSFSFNFTGTPAAPAVFNGSQNWDIALHRRGMSDGMDQTISGHGADCSAPPATHMIDQLSQGVYICRNHLMTSISDRGYGEITLTPNQILDFSQGTATVTFNVSTLRLNSRNWLTFWLSPWTQNIVHPFTDAVDLQGPPRYGVRITGAAGNVGSQKYAAEQILNFNVASSFSHDGTNLEALLPPSAVTRTKFELDVSTTHIRFGMPTVGLWWVDNDFPTPLNFSQALFQINQESYDPCKDQPGVPCPADTWHWSDFYMNPTIPFTILQGDQRAVTPATSSVVHFPAAAPGGSFLRFEAIGPNVRVGFNGGPMQPATMQQQKTSANDRWATFWTPVPAGTTFVNLAADRWWAGDWWIRDPTIWALSAPLAGAPPTAPPTSQATNPPTNPPSGHPTNPPSSKPQPTSQPPSRGGEGGGGTGEGAGHGGSGSGGEGGTASPPPTNIVARLESTVNPTHDPAINLILLGLVAAMIFVVLRAIRSTS